MKLGLISNFREYYDHCFDLSPTDQVIRRITTEGPSKREQFQLLEAAGFTTPLNGIVRDIHEKTTNEYLVVYLDEQLHCGAGKVLLHKDIALKLHPDHYCSIFIPTTPTPMESAVSRRLLAIGRSMWWLRYAAQGSWRSNDNADIKVMNQTLDRQQYAAEGEHDFKPLRQYPLFAIDFVESLKTKQLMAIDLNIAPGMRHTGMEEVVPAHRVAGLLREFVFVNALQDTIES